MKSAFLKNGLCLKTHCFTEQLVLAGLQRDCHPAYFFLCAATAFIERRRSAQQLREAQHSTQAGSQRVAAPAGVAPSRAVGQLAKEGGKRLTDPEFLAWLEVLIFIS